MSFPEQVDPSSELDRLKVAFGMFVAKLIVDADGIVDFGELKLLTQAFPDQLLETMGFLEPNGEFSEAYNANYRQAAKVLPTVLNLEQKLELITLFHRTCMADGELIQAELLVLREASEVLGVPLRILSEHLATLRSLSGGV